MNHPQTRDAGMPMHLFIDSADLKLLEECLASPVVYGVTTNPSILKRDSILRSNLPTFVRQVFDLGASVVQVQVWSQDAAGMISDALEFLTYGEAGAIVPKIPATRQGLKAAAKLASDGIPVTLTAGYALEQALWATQLGVAYLAPYLGRLEDAGHDGLGLIAKMQALLSRNPNNQTRLLVASVRSRRAFLALLELGVGSITVPPSLLPKLLDHVETLTAEQTFLSDAKTISDSN
jgi:transaldolase